MPREFWFALRRVPAASAVRRENTPGFDQAALNPFFFLSDKRNFQKIP
jgi:hypothetical protein